MTTHDRRLLRPVRRRDQRRSVSGVPPAARGGAALLQRAVRLLRGQPLRRRRARPQGPRDVHLRPRRDPRADQGRHRDAAGRHHLRGPADPHRAPRSAVAGVHAEEDERARAADPRVLRGEPRPARRRGPLRLRRRPRRADADARDRHAARDPGAGPGGDPRPRRRVAAHRGGQADDELASTPS